MWNDFNSLFRLNTRYLKRVYPYVYMDYMRVRIHYKSISMELNNQEDEKTLKNIRLSIRSLIIPQNAKSSLETAKVQMGIIMQTLAQRTLSRLKND